MLKRADVLMLAKDRLAIMLFFVTIIFTVAIVVVTLIRLNASDVQIPIRYSDFGSANIYRDQWFMVYTFPVFAVLITILNNYLAIKSYPLSRYIGLGLMGVTVFILATCLIVVNSILNLAPSV